MKPIKLALKNIPELSELEKAANLVRWAKFAYEKAPKHFTTPAMQERRLAKYWELAEHFTKLVAKANEEKNRIALIKILLRNEIEFEIQNGLLYI
jgi:hypothetical protein